MLREVRGTRFLGSRFDKLVFFLSTGGLTETAAPIPVVFKCRHNYTLSGIELLWISLFSFSGSFYT